MAGLAGDVHVAPARRIAVAGEIIILLQIRRVAGRALIVPGLVAAGPMQRAARGQRLVRIKMHPALAALILRPAVPRDPERLIAPARKGDQILLQRIDAEGIGDLVIMQRPVRPFGARHEGIAIAAECRRDAVMIEARAIEVAEHGRRRRLLHRLRMMRASPAFHLIRVATRAGGGADEGRRSGFGLILRETGPGEERRAQKRPKETREPARFHARPCTGNQLPHKAPSVRRRPHCASLMGGRGKAFGSVSASIIAVPGE